MLQNSMEKDDTVTDPRKIWLANWRTPPVRIRLCKMLGHSACQICHIDEAIVFGKYRKHIFIHKFMWKFIAETKSG